VLSTSDDVRAPHELTPAFYGCYDWHSSVHGHWLLVRLARKFPDAPFAAPALAAVGESLTPEHIAGEVSYLKGAGRASFERPYGLAWLLQLAVELREWDDPRARAWSETLVPLERAAVERLSTWLPKLSRPIRIGEHDPDGVRVRPHPRLGAHRERPRDRGPPRRPHRDYYLQDRGCPLSWEPSGQDFLSPCLAEADLMRRVLPAQEYGDWLAAFLPGVPTDGSEAWLAPAVVTDPGDPKLAHLDGLNLSRAWMLEGIASGLPAGDQRLGALRAAAARHRDAGLSAVTGEHYEGGHWLGSFAVYLTTTRGSRASSLSSSMRTTSAHGTYVGFPCPSTKTSIPAFCSPTSPSHSSRSSWPFLSFTRVGWSMEGSTEAIVPKGSV
jgi:hypothetical protein